jgi:hypothetical protein
MSRAPFLAGVLLAAAAMVAADDADAQGRGPSMWDLEGKGQTIEREAPDRRAFLAAISRQYGLDPEELESGELKLVPDKGWVLQRGDEQIELLNLRRPGLLDASARAGKVAEQAAWLAHLVGRFRVGGHVEKVEFLEGHLVTLDGDVKGVADCAAVGAGPGVHCLINATWPTIEPAREGRFSFRPEGSEQVMLFRPAVLVLGLNPDTAEIHATMVTDDSMAHTWAGRLETHTLTARRLTSCFISQEVAAGTPPPCFQPLEIVAEPDSGIVTMMHRAAGVTIRLILQLDPAASADKPMKTKKVR